MCTYIYSAYTFRQNNDSKFCIHSNTQENSTKFKIHIRTFELIKQIINSIINILPHLPLDKTMYH